MNLVDDLQAEIANRLEDLQPDPFFETALLTLVVANVARKNPALPLTAAARKTVSSSFHHVTDALIAERATNFAGQELLIEYGRILIMIALDYEPAASVAAMADADERHGPALERLRHEAFQAVTRSIATGVSPFGALVMTLLGAEQASIERGLKIRQAQKALVEAISVCAMFDSQHKQRQAQANKASSDAAIAEFAEQLGMDLATARRMFENMRDSFYKPPS